MEAVAQSSGYCNCVQAGELIGSQVVPGDTPFTAEVAWIRPRVDGTHGHDEPKPVGGGYFSSSPAAGKRYSVLGGDERRIGRSQGLGTDEVLLDPAQPGAAKGRDIASNQGFEARIGGLGKQHSANSRRDILRS